MHLKQERCRSLFLITGMILSVFLCSFLYAIGPDTIQYQGTVIADNGTIVANGSYPMRFSLWNIEVGGVEAENLKWSEIQTGVKIMKGQFSVELGKISQFPDGLFKDNEKLWIEVAIDLDGSGFKVIGARKLLSSVPYAFVSDEAYSADYASKAGIAEEAKSLQGYSLKDILASKEAVLYWNLIGNAGTTPGTNFLGTTDNQALEIKVNNKRSIRIEPTTKASNIIGGHSVNAVTSSVYGATIGGGGDSGWANTVTDNYGTVSGGASNRAGDNAGTTADRQYATVGGGYTNTAKGYASTIPGGYWNIANGSYSFAAGRRARANHTGSFVWADSQNADFASAANNQFLIRASGGVGINTNNLGAYGLRVASSVAIDGNLNMGYDGSSGRIMYMHDPVDAKDAATKQYVDNKVSSSVNALDKLIHNFVVATGESVTAGDVVVFVNETVRNGYKDRLGLEYVFNGDGTDYISSAAISSDKFVVAYRDIDNFSYGTAVIGTVSGTTIAYGSEYVFNDAGTYDISVSALSTDKFVVAYEDSGNSGYGTAVIGTVSDNTITYGSENVFDSANISYIFVIALSSEKFTVTYRDEGNSNYGTAIIGDVSGTVITYGSEYVFNSGGTDYISATALSSSKFAVAYRDGGNSGYGTVVVGEESSTVITYGSEYVFNNADTYDISAAALSSDKFVVAYEDSGNSGYGTAVIGTVSDNTITYGSEYVFNSANIGFISVIALSSDKFTVAYKDEGNSSYGTVIIGTVSGNTITYSSEYFFNSASTGYISPTTLSSNKFAVAYQDADNSNYGTAVIGEAGIPIGIANASASSGASVPVVIQGVSSSHSGLIPGQSYYHQLDGGLDAIGTDTRIGLAISSTELLLDIER